MKTYMCSCEYLESNSLNIYQSKNMSKKGCREKTNTSFQVCFLRKSCGSRDNETKATIILLSHNFRTFEMIKFYIGAPYANLLNHHELETCKQ
jgi:hypothetical protein